MMNEEQNPKVHHMTAKAARNALAGKQISPESYAAVLRDELSLDEAKDLGRDRGPKGEPLPASTIGKDDTTQECWCGVCGEQTKPGRRFLAGHDQRTKGIIKRAIRAGEIESLTERQREYAEERNLIEETEQQMAEEERKREAKIAAKTEREAEHKAKK